MIPGIIISLVTFPGVIIHELAHKVFCYLFGVRVYEVVYFQVKDLSAPVGYVLHDPPQNFRHFHWSADFEFHIDDCHRATSPLEFQLKARTPHF